MGIVGRLTLSCGAVRGFLREVPHERCYGVGTMEDQEM